jgi:hypothetical protein
MKSKTTFVKEKDMNSWPTHQKKEKKIMKVESHYHLNLLVAD